MYSIFVIARISTYDLQPTYTFFHNLSNGPSDIADITLAGLVSNIYRNACFLSVSLWFQILISVLQSESSHFYYR